MLDIYSTPKTTQVVLLTMTITTTDIANWVIVSMPVRENISRDGIATTIDQNALDDALMETPFSIATPFDPKDLAYAHENSTGVIA